MTTSADTKDAGHTPGVIFHPAECSTNCDAWDCPYTHSDSWEACGMHWPTEQEARAAISRAEGR